MRWRKTRRQILAHRAALLLAEYLQLEHLKVVLRGNPVECLAVHRADGIRGAVAHVKHAVRMYKHFVKACSQAADALKIVCRIITNKFQTHATPR
jgi:hypothetical protein